MPSRDATTYKQVLDWLMPVLLGAVITVGAGVCGVLWQIAGKLGGIDKSLAVAVQRVDDHERRLDNLETLFMRQTSP